MPSDLTIALDADATSHRNGYGRSFEIQEGQLLLEDTKEGYVKVTNPSSDRIPVEISPRHYTVRIHGEQVIVVIAIDGRNVNKHPCITKSVTGRSIFAWKRFRCMRLTTYTIQTTVNISDFLIIVHIQIDHS